MTEQRILITGVAGFIGNHVAHRLIGEGRAVTGLDSVNAYYDTDLKEARLRRLVERGVDVAGRVVINDWPIWE